MRHYALRRPMHVCVMPMPAQRRHERRPHLRHKINTNAVKAFSTLTLDTQEAAGTVICVLCRNVLSPMMRLLCLCRTAASPFKRFASPLDLNRRPALLCIVHYFALCCFVRTCAPHARFLHMAPCARVVHSFMQRDTPFLKCAAVCSHTGNVITLYNIVPNAG
jgi:hypothetical protein